MEEKKWDMRPTEMINLVGWGQITADNS